MEDKILHCQFPAAPPWCGPAVNPVVGTGLPHSSWRGRRIAPLNPGVGTGLSLQSCCGNRIALLPGIGARPRLPGIEASCRAHAKVEILPSKKNVEVVGLDDNREKIFPVVLWGDNCLKFRRTCPALKPPPRPHHLPGIEASSLPAHRGRNSDFAFLPKKPITGPAPKVRQRGCPRSIADGVFFHHSHAQPSILLWQQDCSTQSCCGNRIAPSILLWQQDCSPARHRSPAAPARHRSLLPSPRQGRDSSQQKKCRGCRLRRQP